MCLVLVSFGYDSRKVENEMGGPELQLRFMDCLKLLRRQQQMQAMTMIGTVGSFLAKNKQKTILEEINDDIAHIDALTGHRAVEKEIDTRTPEQRKKDQDAFLRNAALARESFIAYRRKSISQRKLERTPVR